MTTDLALDRLFTEETARLEGFRQEFRQAMRAMMRETEEEFRDFVERLVQEQAAALEKQAQALLAATSAATPDIAGIAAGNLSVLASRRGQFSSASLLDKTLAVALSAAIAGLSRRKRRHRHSSTFVQSSAVTGVAQSLGTAIGRTVTGQAPEPAGRVRLSRSQITEQLARELARGQRNS